MQGYYPEMNQARPENTEIDARLSYTGRHWIIKTPLTLKGRGIKFEEVLKAEQLTEAAQHKAGWNEYTVTQKAFDKLDAQYKISAEFLLD